MTVDMRLGNAAASQGYFGQDLVRQLAKPMVVHTSCWCRVVTLGLKYGFVYRAAEDLKWHLW